MITKFKAQNFTAFENIDIDFAKGINIFIGKNGTGKTHIMKVAYAVCCLIDSREPKTLVQKIDALFLPQRIGRLVSRIQGRSTGSFEVYRETTSHNTKKIKLELTTNNKTKVSSLSTWQEDKRFQAIYIPVKDMLANAPGFRSLYNNKYLHVEEIYADIIDKALLPAPRGKASKERKELINTLAEALDGKVVEENEAFFLKNASGKLEFTLLAEGYRKLGLLYKLIQNESLANGSVLFWDEPEANLNPALTKVVVNILLKLSQMGTQIFIATHNYSLLKNFELEASDDTSIHYHSFYHNESGKIAHTYSNKLEEVEHNAVDQAYTELLDRSITKKMNHDQTSSR